MPVERWDSLDAAAHEAYDAYGASVDWFDYQGKPMPQWDALPLSIRRAWGASARRLLAKAYQVVADHLVTHIQEDCAANVAAILDEGN